MRCSVFCRPDLVSSVHLRIEVSPELADTVTKRSGLTPGHKRKRIRPARAVIPATRTKDAIMRGIMALLHFDAGDPPDHEEANDFENNPGGDEHRRQGTVQE